MATAIEKVRAADGPFCSTDDFLRRRYEDEIYFSDHWDWEPGVELEPRRERWGGLLVALFGLVGYVGFIKRDRLVIPDDDDRVWLQVTFAAGPHKHEAY